MRLLSLVKQKIGTTIVHHPNVAVRRTEMMKIPGDLFLFFSPQQLKTTHEQMYNVLIFSYFCGKEEEFFPIISREGAKLRWFVPNADILCWA